jgi:hypothetical protein
MSVTVLEREKAFSAGDDTMTTLTQKWYNTMVAGLGLSPQTFQIYQSNVVLGDLSTNLWAIYDSIPPLSITQQAQSAQISRFSNNYGGVLTSLQPSGSLEWKKTMGDSYPDWVTYLNTTPKPALPAGGMLALFSNWAQMNIPDPGKAQKAVTEYSQILNGIVPVAMGQFLGAAGVYAYNQSVDDLTSAIKQAPAASFAFDSSTASSDIEHTWAEGSASGFFGFFGGGGSVDSISQKFGSSDVTINVSFQHVLAFAAGPLQNATFVGDKTYPAWFSSSALNEAFQNKGNDVWDVDGSASWASTFGDSGNLKRFATNLVVGDGMTMTMSSSSAFSSSEQVQIRQESSGGFWPFYHSSSSGSTSNVTFDDQGKLTVTSTSPAGSPLILGTNVQTIDQIFG